MGRLYDVYDLQDEGGMINGGVAKLAPPPVS